MLTSMLVVMLYRRADYMWVAAGRRRKLHA